MQISLIMSYQNIPGDLRITYLHAFKGSKAKQQLLMALPDLDKVVGSCLKPFLIFLAYCLYLCFSVS